MLGTLFIKVGLVRAALQRKLRSNLGGWRASVGGERWTGGA